MSDGEQEEASETTPENQRPSFVVPEHEPSNTGDPVLDRGLAMNAYEHEAALADPEHPDHAAAKAANEHLAKKLRPMAERFGRINSNLAAARIFSGIDGMVKPTPSIPKSLRPKLETYRPEDVRINMPEPDRTPQRTLEATQALSEQMSEMIRVAAEELEHQKREAADNKSYGTLMLRIAVAALIVSIIGSVLSIVVTLLAAG